jgi:hypothetical protein
MSDAAPRPGADEEWENLLRQWRNQQSTVRPRPYFYGRLRARLFQEAAAPRSVPGWLRWPAYAAALTTLLLALSGDSAALRPTPYEARPTGSSVAWPGR